MVLTESCIVQNLSGQVQMLRLFTADMGLHLKMTGK